MDDGASNEPYRLDSWKSIAAYLNRDIRTVRRWEALGLPIRRVAGGRGRSVFAYASEIDAWLKASHLERTPPVEPPVVPAPAGAPRRHLIAAAAGTLVIVAVAIVIWRMQPTLTANDLRIDTRPDGFVAVDGAGRSRWRYTTATGYDVIWSSVPPGWTVVSGPQPTVFAATAYRQRRIDQSVESGELLAFGISGTLRHAFSFTDRVRLEGREYGPPWCITGFAVDERSRRVAVAAHHYQWSAGMVTILDDRFERLGTYTQAGWIEGVRWIAENRLLIGGFNQAQDGGMVALIDTSTIGRQPPQQIVVMPRTELNRTTGSPFNRAILEFSGDDIVARTIEVPTSASREAVDALYEFSPDLRLLRASFSDRYWELHDALYAEGRLSHDRQHCPDRDGPREIRSWDPSGGWRTLRLNGPQ